ncbi:MAG: GNAT family N-acetyltransferase [Melioribacteraceae bacterium]|nr:GNAT family N-acetyltransferase [Melioribacteraceae bacterium]
MKEPKELNFIKLSREHVDTLIKWADEEGWNPGPYDAEVYWNTDPEGFYGFFENDELIAGGSIISYNGDFGFMGFFIVKPEYRSNGIGKKLWYLRRDALLKRLNEGASIGMDGVVDMQPFYNRGGFQIAFRDLRYEGIGKEYLINKNISPVEEKDYAEILKYDKMCFGFDRPQFMLNWLQMPEVKTFKYIENNELKGFAVLRKANKGYKICPLFADTPEIAEELFKACSSSVKDDLFYLDIPIINESAKTLVDKYKMKYVFECARMYYSTPPNVPVSKIFGITTFELG